MRPALLLLLLVALSAACAPRAGIPARPTPETLPPGSPLLSRTLDDRSAWLRHFLMFGEHPQALDALQRGSPIAPDDPLLRALQEAVVLHEAGEYGRSNQLLEQAEVEADLRYTRSLRREAASLLINDRVLAYTPSAAELVMVPYYRMLNYLALGQMEGALVESRKANALLARLERGRGDRCHEDALVQYLAGLVQRAGGELNDALVSLRLAEGTLAACGAGATETARKVAGDLYQVARATGLSEIADSLAVRYALEADTARAGAAGDVLVLVHHGFVAHRVEEALHVPLLPEDVEELESGDADGIAAAAARISARLMHNARERAVWGRSWDDTPLAQWAHALDGAYVLRLAWPGYRREAGRPEAVRVRLGDTLAEAAPAGDLSRLIRSELEAERAGMLTRLVVRGVTRYLISREVEKRAEKKSGEAAAFLLGRIANLAGNQLEQADTRSWSLLPDRISMVRMRLPAGTHRVRIELPGESGRPEVVHDAGEVRVEAGRLVVLHRRVWATGRGESAPTASGRAVAADSTGRSAAPGVRAVGDQLNGSTGDAAVDIGALGPGQVDQ